ncbi:hypothetical protein BIV24_17110 [Streptomyces colonosanans]|uniref:Uncharacterized protein n=1 Tax=Streptomyces colonosanans TaxID=1428652 RepID=A0A1S2PAW3_9ACTN|nr:hypothetical protein BIV24_17110 [Streptomyces colonosanans]
MNVVVIDVVYGSLDVRQCSTRRSRINTDVYVGMLRAQMAQRCIDFRYFGERCAGVDIEADCLTGQRLKAGAQTVEVSV